MTDINTKLIQEQNDTVRREITIPKHLKTIPCNIVFTGAIVSKFDNVMMPIILLVQSHNEFDQTDDTGTDESESNDPYGEHDFGVFDYLGERIYFKIDYYDKTLENGSENPSDLNLTIRVLTIMLAADY